MCCVVLYLLCSWDCCSQEPWPGLQVGKHMLSYSTIFTVSITSSPSSGITLKADDETSQHLNTCMYDFHVRLSGIVIHHSKMSCISLGTSLYTYFRIRMSQPETILCSSACSCPFCVRSVHVACTDLLEIFPSMVSIGPDLV